jgi:hypothetical protein
VLNSESYSFSSSSESQPRENVEVRENMSNMDDADDENPFDYSIEEESTLRKIWNYMTNSSLFLISKKCEFRQQLLTIVTTPEDIIIKEKALISPEKYGIESSNPIQHFKSIDINSGKILTTKSKRQGARIFEVFIVVVILLSCILLCIDTPLDDPDTSLSKALMIIDYLFTAIFLCEAILKIMAFGFFWNNYQGISAYIFNWWNVLDFLVVLMSLIDIFITLSSGGSGSSSNLNSFKALRAIRALRPLRMISRSKGLRIAIQALIASVPAMGNVLIICLLFLLIFAILGVNFFKGEYYSWVISDESLLSKVDTKDDWLNLGGKWEAYPSNFDNVMIAWVTLFEMMTTEGWVDIMTNGIDARGIEKQPKKDNDRAMILYFVIFMVLGSFLIINLFTAVITDNFNKIKESKEIGAHAFNTETRVKEWIDAQNLGINVKPQKTAKPPLRRWRQKFFWIVSHQAFDLFIIVIIILNTIILAMAYARMSDSYRSSLLILNYIFVFLYNIEFAVKFIAYGTQYFTHDSWNIFDFVWVVGSDIILFFDIFGLEGSFKSLFIFLRAFRMIRLLRFINNYGGAKTIATLVYAAPEIQNIMTLVSLITFIYAVLGLNLFATVMYREHYTEQNNFRNIFDSLILLLRWITGEDWNAIMHELASKNSYDGVDWVDNQSYDEMDRDGVRGWGNWMAYPFFITFFIINAVVILDLSIGVFISALSEARKYDICLFGRKQLNDFLELWSEYDPDATGWITVDEWMFLIYELPYPYGKGLVKPEYEQFYNIDKIYSKLLLENKFIFSQSVKAENSDSVANNIMLIENEHEYFWVNSKKGIVIKDIRTAAAMSNYNIPVYTDHKVHFKDVLRQIILNSFQATNEHFLPQQKVIMKFNKKWKVKSRSKKVIVDKIELYMAARMMYNKFKLIKRRRLDQYNDQIEVNDAKFFTDARDQTVNMHIEAFHRHNPFFKGMSGDDTPKSKLQI